MSAFRKLDFKNPLIFLKGCVICTEIAYIIKCDFHHFFWWNFPGIDGSTKHPVFKGKQASHVVDDDAEEQDQQVKRDPGHCLLSCLVPLQLVGKLPNGRTVVLYKNKLCNSALSGK